MAFRLLPMILVPLMHLHDMIHCMLYLVDVLCCSSYWGLTPMSLWDWLFCLSACCSGLPGYSAGLGVDPAGGAPGGLFPPHLVASCRVFVSPVVGEVVIPLAGVCVTLAIPCDPAGGARACVYDEPLYFPRGLPGYSAGLGVDLAGGAPGGV
ncbi:hypothetical protein F511_04970 [Dorcoceras hygrometricum]|uniref:Uncharacterized protein n=1 Tax=Dorcoceras hygrometricum TaxID=472368 RepID=A0A2Z7CZK7_9LAMI|nr:hypothetical protein F511_04970 [Dorcoceras hygrometricum]